MPLPGIWRDCWNENFIDHSCAVLLSIPVISIIVASNLYFMVYFIDGRHIIGAISVGALIYINVVIFVILRILDHESKKTNEYKNANVQLNFSKSIIRKCLRKLSSTRLMAWYEQPYHYHAVFNQESGLCGNRCLFTSISRVASKCGGS